MGSNGVISSYLLKFIEFFNPENPNNLLNHYTPLEELNLDHLRRGGKVKIKHNRCGSILEVTYKTNHVNWYEDVPDEFKICCRKCGNDKRKALTFLKYGVEYFTQTEQGRQNCALSNTGKHPEKERFKRFQKYLFESEKAGLLKINEPFDSQKIMIDRTISVTHVKCGCMYDLDFTLAVRKDKDIPLEYRIKCPNVDCIQEYREFETFKKYGVKHTSSLDSTKSKKIQTNLDRYGVPHAAMSDEIQEKKKNTVRDKYGVENVFQMDGMVERLKEISLETYGVDNYSKTEEARKAKQDAIINGENPNFGGWYFSSKKDRSDYLINGIQYRSFWEIKFHKEHPELKYESVIIPYYLDKDPFEKKYLVDFVDYENKILYEIKPMFMFNKHYNREYNQTMAKVKAAIKWSKENGYKYKIVTEKNYNFT